MIKIKNTAEIQLMRDAGKITAGALKAAEEAIAPGVTLLHIDTVIRHFIEKHGAVPSFLGYGGFPASACISINEQVIHGIPDASVLADGDVVKVDVGAKFKGYHGDSARTFFCGKVSDEAIQLEKVTRECFFEGIKLALPEGRIGDIANAVQNHAESAGFSVVRDYVGHGIGENLHESPDVPNFGRAGRGVRLYEGMTLAVEPMINAGVCEVKVLPNKWTVVTRDGKISAHYENTIAITANGPEILTKI